MTDVTDYIVGSSDEHTHTVRIGEESSPILLDSPELIRSVLAGSSDNDYEVAELLGEVSIPYVLYNYEPTVGAQCFSAIMKRLYNVCSPIAVLKNPRDNEEFKYVICAPYSRVNREMLKEVMETFKILCDYRHIEYTPSTIQYLPLTWEVTAFKEGREIDNESAFDDNPSIVLSARLSSESLASKVKMNGTQNKRAALIDSISLYSREEIKSDKIKAIELIPLISKDRSRDMSLFLAMGRCLYRIFQGDSEGLEQWRLASVPQVQSLCDEYYPSLDTTCTYYRIHTLQYWAKKDSPEKYKEWNSISIMAALEASVMATGGHLDIANVAYRKDPTLFICDGDEPKDAVFFMFNGTYYKPCGVFALQNHIDKHLIPEYEDFLRDLSSKVGGPSSSEDTSFKEIAQKKIDKCIQIIVKLKSDAFQMNVIKCLMRLYNRPGFDNIRDSNPNLTCFEDCVFDAERKCIRDGIPEDNLTCSTGYAFKEIWNEYNNYTDVNGTVSGWNHPHVKSVLDNLHLIISDPDKRDILRRENASLLHGSNPLKRGLIVHGPTNNGKSALYSWIGKALGDTYCPDVPNNLFYSVDAHPGGATPHFEMTRFARLILQSEVDDSMTLNEALFKRWTGGTDKVTYRGLYKSKIRSFTPCSKPVTVCNTFAKINGNSPALRTRTLVLKLDSKFITEKDPEFEQIRDMSQEERTTFMSENRWYWADTQFNETIERTYKAFMWIMIQDYISYSRTSGHTSVPAKIIPRKILEDTVEYFARSNIFAAFLKASVVRNQGGPGVSTYALYNSYKKWYGDFVNRFGHVNFDKFICELESMGFRHHNEIYHNLSLKMNTLS